MCNTFNNFLFGTYPYIAVAIFVVASLIRYDREQYSWHASSSLLLNKTHAFIIGNNLFHWGIILLLAGHFVGLLTPHWLYANFISASNKQLLAMVAGGIFGTIAFIGLTILILRRLFNQRVRATSKTSDFVILFMLYVQLIIGLMSIYVSAQHMDGSSMMALAQWVQDIVTFQPHAADVIKSEPLIFKLHIFIGLSILVVFPFTRLVHILSMPIHYLWRTGYQIVRARTAR